MNKERITVSKKKGLDRVKVSKTVYFKLNFRLRVNFVALAVNK
jgi:hypothetical protein